MKVDNRNVCYANPIAGGTTGGFHCVSDGRKSGSSGVL